MFRGYSEFFVLSGEIIRDTIQDYINYKKAQTVLWKYQHKDNFCTVCGVLNQHELEALSILAEHEKILKNKRSMKIRIKNSKKTA